MELSIALPHGFMGYFAGFPDIAIALILLGISLALAFAGRRMVKGLAFIVTGTVFGVAGAVIGGSFLGTFGALLGAVTGFVVGGFIGMTVVVLGIGIAVGYIGYSVANGMFANEAISLVAGLVLFFIGIMLADKLLEAATAILGGLLFFNVMTSLGSGEEVGAIMAFLVALLGLWTQTRGPASRAKKVEVVSPTVQ